VYVQADWPTHKKQCKKAPKAVPTGKRAKSNSSDLNDGDDADADADADADDAEWDAFEQ
jgi:hypothetical protein